MGRSRGQTKRGCGMQSAIWPAVDRGRQYAFAAVWAAVFATGVGLSEPLPSLDDVAPYLSFAPVGTASAAPLEPPTFLAMNAAPEALVFVRHDVSEPDDTFHRSTRELSFGHGRFAAPGNAIRRQVQLRPINPRTADELAGFFRDAAYTLTEVRQGEAVPPIRVERVPADREQLLYLRDKMFSVPMTISAIERIWLEDLAERYGTPADNIDELVRKVDVVPPSMAIAQGGVESGWGTSVAARSKDLL